MEHTQMHLAVKKGTKISIILTILEEFLVYSLFYETKFSKVDMKVQVYFNCSKKNLDKDEISKINEEWKISPSQV
jgi:hypothetical protein